MCKDKETKSENISAVICKNCSIIFQLKKYVKSATFCSRKCSCEYAKKSSGSTRNCLVCNKEFYAKGNPSGRKLCSQKCNGLKKSNIKELKCNFCGSQIFRTKNRLIRSKNHFCNKSCANKFQKIKMIKINCKICKKIFEVYPSDIKHSKIRNYKIQYCSNKCYHKDPDRIEYLIKMNEKQNKNKSRNKLEQAGIEILQKLNLDFEEQFLINNKISVDIFIKNFNLIIEWWGDYWHGHQTKIKNGNPDKRQQKRMLLDKSQRKYLEKCGYKLITFWEHEIIKNPNLVEAIIKESTN